MAWKCSLIELLLVYPFLVAGGLMVPHDIGRQQARHNAQRSCCRHHDAARQFLT
jgi:hypothetical protein